MGAQDSDSDDLLFVPAPILAIEPMVWVQAQSGGSLHDLDYRLVADFCAGGMEDRPNASLGRPALARNSAWFYFGPVMGDPDARHPVKSPSSHPPDTWAWAPVRAEPPQHPSDTTTPARGFTEPEPNSGEFGPTLFEPGRLRSKFGPNSGQSWQDTVRVG